MQKSKPIHIVNIIQLWAWKILHNVYKVVNVLPVPRPHLPSSGTRYWFPQEIKNPTVPVLDLIYQGHKRSRIP